jgi:hypothetical protein
LGGDRAPGPGPGAEDDHAVAQKGVSFYKEAYTYQEVADLVDLAVEGELNEELSVVRVALRRAMIRLGEQLSQAEYARLTSLVFSGATTIARLMQTRRALSLKAAQVIAMAMPKALDEISKEKNVDL